MEKQPNESSLYRNPEEAMTPKEGKLKENTFNKRGTIFYRVYAQEIRYISGE